MIDAPSTVPPASPLVVQVGFAGSRMLFDPAAHPGVDEAAFHQEVEAHLVSLLRDLPKTLCLTEHHFPCGISSGAIGADTIFTRACKQRGIDQRIFLPERREAFFAAIGSENLPDFTPAQAAQTGEVLDSPHIIEERVVSISRQRTQRFDDVNLEIVRVSDVCIAIRREGAQAKHAGTADFIGRASARKKLVHEIIVSVRDGHAHCEGRWLAPDGQTVQPGPPHFAPPGVPPILGEFSIDPGARYAAELMRFTSDIADNRQKFFKSAARWIIGTHVTATILAVAGVAFLDGVEFVLAAFLLVEAIVLIYGYRTHRQLHHENALENWATARLICETARSVLNAGQVRTYLQHLFLLPYPEPFRSVLRTLNIHHLRETRDLASDTWPQRRAAYIRDRLHHDREGQIPYYTTQRDKAWRWLRRARRCFATFSIGAIVAVVAKLGLVSICALATSWHVHAPGAEHTLGFLTVVLPVLAVAALSLAASFDLEARFLTYSEMVVVLEQHRDHLCTAASEGEFHSLALRTEARLVGENVNWFSRRVFTKVS
ncbi:MAG: hypothetical protein ABMA13_02620 [Chthoniobacteraceae bacterium]